MKRIVMLLVMLLALASTRATTPDILAAEELNGALVYSERCALCHQPRAPAEFSDRAWSVIIHHMHTRGYLTEQEVKAVRTFLMENNTVAFSAPPASGGETSGSALVAQRGCQGCHVVNGKGGAIGPNLDTLFSRRDAAYVMQKLSKPTFDNPRSIMPFFNLNESQKKALVAYLKTIQK